MKFERRLKKAIKNFDLKSALELSDEIHDAESQGYQIPFVEDRLWIRLTNMCEKNKGEII